MADFSSPNVERGDRRWSMSMSAGMGMKVAPSPDSIVPQRRSSKLRLKKGAAVRSSLDEIALESPVPPLPPPHETPRHGLAIRPRGRASSPLRKDDSRIRKAPSRTFVPNVFPEELLYEPRLTHPRVLLDLRLSSPIFMGGATVEGEVHLVLDGGLIENKRKGQSSVSICRISVSLLGIESCKSKQEIFRVLTTYLIDDSHSPPLNMAPEPAGDGSWTVQPSSSIIPFRLDLPVMMGPPPYVSKKVRIRYSVVTTIDASIGPTKLSVRHSKDVVVLTVHDPEKALVNLSNPLTVTDEMHFSLKKGVQKIILAAGIHRQTWIGGYPIFVDVNIDNRSGKIVKKIELQLEKTTTFHSHSAPCSIQGSADSLRLPDHIQKEIVARKIVSDGMRGILPISQDLATYQIELPTGSLSIETGRFFGVRFFLNIKISCSFYKHLKIQLPITIIHPNSIDIPTNALAQVTASIEHKHRNLTSTSGTGSPYRYRPGQAFTNARRESYLKLRKDTLGSDDMGSLTRALEASPRRLERHPLISPDRIKITRRQSASAFSTKYRSNSSHQRHRTLSKQHTSFDNGVTYCMPRISHDTTRFREARGSFEAPPHQQPQSGPSMLQQTNLNVDNRSSLEAKVHKGLRGISIDMSMQRGPRLQKSTSGLAFDLSDESDKENCAP